MTPLRIYKDFSEFTVPRAAEQLEEAARRDGEVAVICVNEAHLRAVLESGAPGSACAKLLEDFKRSFHDGLASLDGEIHFVNLNFQSVAAGDGESLINRALQEWLSGTRWRTCQDCDSRHYCPIYHNRNMLSPQVDESANRRREKLESVLGHRQSVTPESSKKRAPAGTSQHPPRPFTHGGSPRERRGRTARMVTFRTREQRRG